MERPMAERWEWPIRPFGLRVLDEADLPDVVQDSLFPGGVRYLTEFERLPPNTACRVGGRWMINKPQPHSMLPGSGTRFASPSEQHVFELVERIQAKVRAWSKYTKARLRRERAEQAMRERVEQAILQKLPTRPRSLSPARRNIEQVLKAMSPEDLDSLQGEVLIGKVQDKIDAEYDGVGRSRSRIQPMLKEFLQSRLSRRR
jgi:hypothetical protein